MISVTDLTSYLFCPRKLYLERVLGLVEPHKEAIVKGSVIHKAMEYLTNSEEAIVKSINSPLTKLELFELYKLKSSELFGEIVQLNRARIREFFDTEEFFIQNLSLIVSDSAERAARLCSFMAQNKLLGSELWAALMPKMVSELKLRSETLGLSGVVDRADFYETCIVPLEIKTGKAPGRGTWHGHEIQLAAYALLLKEHYGLEVKEGNVRYTAIDESRIVRFNHFHFHEVKALTADVQKLFASRKVPMFCKKTCFYCGNPNNKAELLMEKMKILGSESI